MILPGAPASLSATPHEPCKRVKLKIKLEFNKGF